MNNEIRTDLHRHNAGRSNIFIVQPKLTVGISKARFLSLGQKELHAILNSFLETAELVHYGWLEVYNFNNNAKLKTCGKELVIQRAKPMLKGEKYNCHIKPDYTKVHLKCGCGDEFLAICDLSGLSDYLFFLALKQMMPDLRMCNYFFCKIFDEGESVNEAWSYNVERLQDKSKHFHPETISLVKRVLATFSRSEDFPTLDWNDLGFTLMPGMNTFDTFDGFDRWARFLHFEWEKRVMQVFRGPKPGDQACS